MFSINKLFTSMKHGDPKAMALTAVTVFCVSVGWFSWTLLVPPASEPLPLGSMPGRQAAPGEGVHLSKLIQEQQTAKIPESDPNPFYRKPPGRPARQPNRSRDKRDTEESVTEGSRRTGPAAESRPPPPPPPPEPTTRTLEITFHGMLTRPDHTTVAMITTSDDPRSRFVKVGDELATMTIGSITSDSLEIQQERGQPEFLGRGHTRSLEIPK
jgi:hypothetical protein